MDYITCTCRHTIHVTHMQPICYLQIGMFFKQPNIKSAHINLNQIKLSPHTCTCTTYKGINIILHYCIMYSAHCRVIIQSIEIQIGMRGLLGKLMSCQGSLWAAVLDLRWVLVDRIHVMMEWSGYPQNDTRPVSSSRQTGTCVEQCHY